MPRFISIITLTILAGMISGCSPAYVKRLDLILSQKSINNRDRLDYRCTSGAHRGASTEHLENTLEALITSDKDDKYAFIEFDVQYTRDKKIVVYHDKRLLRLFGSIKAIGDTPFADLMEISSGEIAAYDRVMDALTKKLNIEIKSRGDDEEDRQLVDEIMADIHFRKREKDVMISSISRDVVSYVNRKYPRIPTGQVFWLTSSTYLHFETLTKNLYDYINETQADYLILYQANLRNINDLLRLKPKGKTLIFWDFDDTIFMVHKDLSDRLWGVSASKNFFQYLRYHIVSLFHSPAPNP